MKLLVENADYNLVENTCIVNDNKEKEWWVSGIFMQAECVNQNNRWYPRSTMQREVSNYQDKINANDSLGEIDHADEVTVNYERASHIIKELRMEGNNVIGKAKILKNNVGKGIIIPLLEEKVKIGMSSRALGSIKESIDEEYDVIDDDFQLLCVDIVSNPSARDAYVSIMENKEFFIENGILKEKKMDEYERNLKCLKKNELNEGIVNIFSEFINEIKNKG